MNSTELSDIDIKNFTEWAEGNKYLFELLCNCKKNGIKTFASCGGHKDSEFEPEDFGPACSDPYIGLFIDSNSLPFIKKMISKLKDMQDIEINCGIINSDTDFRAISFHANNTNCCELFYKINSAITNKKESNKNISSRGNIFKQMYRDIKARMLYRGVKKVYSSSKERLESSGFESVFNTKTKDFYKYEKDKHEALIEQMEIPGFEELHKKYGYLQREYYPPIEQTPVALLEEPKSKSQLHVEYVNKQKCVLPNKMIIDKRNEVKREEISEEQEK